MTSNFFMLPLAVPTDFAGGWQILDWSLGRDGLTSRSGGGLPSILPAGALVINETGPVARMRYCSQDDCDVNFWQDEGLLIARDPSAATVANSTPIMFTFATPLRAVGAYVAAIGDSALDDLPLHAVWVKATDNPQWALVSGDGKVARTLGAGALASAPFVGATASGTSGIEKICFDATLAGNFEKLAVSRLFWAA